MAIELSYCYSLLLAVKMLYYSMSFVSLDVDVEGSSSHCCCNVFGDLVVVNEGDDSFYLKLSIK